jgi:hypothetical protein
MKGQQPGSSRNHLQKHPEHRQNHEHISQSTKVTIIRYISDYSHIESIPKRPRMCSLMEALANPVKANQNIPSYLIEVK